MFDVGSSLKIQQYLNNQTLDNDVLNFLSTMKFNELYTNDQYQDISDKINTYRALEQENKINPSAEVSKQIQELNQDIFYLTGQDASKIQLSNLKTTSKVDEAMMATNLRSKNDLFVQINYDDYSTNSNYVKCRLTGHDDYGAYGIAANARMIVTKDGTIITTKNALYCK